MAIDEIWEGGIKGDACMFNLIKPWWKSEQVEDERCLQHGPLGPMEMSLNQAHRGIELIQSSGIQNLRGLLKNATSWTSRQVH